MGFVFNLFDRIGVAFRIHVKYIYIHLVHFTRVSYFMLVNSGLLNGSDSCLWQCNEFPSQIERAGEAPKKPKPAPVW